MFSVIICSKQIIEACRTRFNMFLKPLLENDGFAFCEWNILGETLDEAVPELKGLVANKKEWRAMIVQDGETFGKNIIDMRNPFDWVGTVKNLDEIDPGDYFYADEKQKQKFEKTVSDFREKKYSNYTKAAENPLTRLAIWLCGSPMRHEPELPDEYADIPEEIGEEYFRMLNERRINVSEYEIEKASLAKWKALEYYKRDSEVSKPAKHVMLVSERSTYSEDEIAKTAWRNKTEFEYSRFYDDNLYPEKVRYLLCDVNYVNEFRNENKYLDFLTVILLAAVNECPFEALRSNRVYRFDARVDSEKLRAACRNYDGKLRVTYNKLRGITEKYKKRRKEPIDDETAENLFEEGVKIPVEIESRYPRDDLMAEYDEIGLSKDCPGDEEQYWDGQQREIRKTFVRYIREPQRELKRVVTGEFRDRNKIEDELILRLDEFQEEDIVYKLQEEEQGMVETKTAQIYNTAEYNERMDKADKELRHAIAQRMNKKKTVLVAVVAAVAYLLGFIPMFFSDFKTDKSTTVVILIILAAILIFLAVGFVFLFVLRKRLVNRFKHFNFVMSGICDEIEDGLDAFSRYLSHACNVMREFSVIRCIEGEDTQQIKVIRHHMIHVERRIEEFNRMFSRYLDYDNTDLSEFEPYDYDYTQFCEYSYEMQCEMDERDINFMQPGFKITVPIDYLDSVTLVREELYD